MNQTALVNRYGVSTLERVRGVKEHPPLFILYPNINVSSNTWQGSYAKLVLALAGDMMHVNCEKIPCVVYAWCATSVGPKHSSIMRDFNANTCRGFLGWRKGRRKGGGREKRKT